MMDFVLRCNYLQCRAQLTERAIVTTCSHIFCTPCSQSLGLSAAPSPNRLCPACKSVLSNPDDAVSTSLNPTDDYKTSVLSGLPPNTIMECAGRALAFWSYQSTQEIVYQEYLAKSLTNKYNQANVQMDNIINQANSELEVTNQKLNNLLSSYEKIREENTQLLGAYREKTRKCQQTQELYNRLKRKQMTEVTQSAAFDSVDEALGTSRNNHGLSQNQRTDSLLRSPQRAHTLRPASLDAMTGNKPLSEEDIGVHHRAQGNNMMPPPPPRRAPVEEPWRTGGPLPTPSNHRTRLGTARSPGNFAGPSFPSHSSSVNRTSPRNIPMNQHQRISPVLGAGIDGHKGYGMSAGIKVGRRHSPKFPPPELGRASWW